MKNITILGGGSLGSQIAFQAAYLGYNTIIWVRSEESMDRTSKKIDMVRRSYENAVSLMAIDKSLDNWCVGISDYHDFDKDLCYSKIREAYKNINILTDIKEAVKDADLVIESVVEDLNVKKDVLKQISKLLKPETLVVTNSSNIVPSKLARSSGRPDKFLAFHFSNRIWKNNSVEIMRHKSTSEDTFNKMIEFAKDFRMEALLLNKEKSGYILNTIMIPFAFAALDLYVKGISDVKSIDKSWKLGTGAPYGPFEMMDSIGIPEVREVSKKFAQTHFFLSEYDYKAIDELLLDMIENHKLGKVEGEGFYKY